MQYTTLGKTGLEVSRLGFGCMRLPMKTDSEIDRTLAIPLLHRAVELGVTYFDTAVGYCAGDSQRVVGEALESMRDKVVISTKNHHYDKTDKDGWWKNLNDSLERLRTDHIDIYNLHGMNFERYESAVAGDDGLYNELLKAKEQGMIRHICHSFHGSVESLKKCVETGLFESVTVQYNLLDQSLEEGMIHAGSHGMGVVIMGPVGGGRLGFPGGKANEIAGEVKSTPELALRFVLSNEHVNVALSGMSDLQQLEENVATVSNLGELTATDHERIEAAVEERKKLAGLYCTGCNYCMPCPDAVDIPANFEILNLDRVFGLSDHAKSKYASLGGKAALCRQCGKCVELCPQELDIPTRLGESVSMLDERSGSVSGWGELRSGAIDEDGMLSVGLRYQIKNFTEEAYDSVDVSLRSHREEEIAPGSFSVTKLKEYGRRHKDLAVRVVPPLESLSIDSVISFDGSNTVEHLSYVVTAAKKITDVGGDGATVPPNIGSIHVPSPVHPAHTSPKTIKNHSFDFAVGYDDSAVTVWCDVEDDLLSLAATDPVGRMTKDCLRIYLDGRSSERMGIGGYGDGVLSVTVFPSGENDEKPFVQVSNGVEVQVVSRRTDIGYAFRMIVPWNAFGEMMGVPSVMGLDLAQISHDADGKNVLRMAWTGRNGQDRDTASFGRLLLV